MKTGYWLLLLCLLGLLFHGVSKAANTGKTFPTLTIGLATYTNATVTDISSGAVSIRHAGGIASVRIESLDQKALNDLGIPAPTPRSERRTGSSVSSSSGAGASQPATSTEPLEKSESSPSKHLGSFIGDNGSKLEGVLGIVVAGFALIGFGLVLAGKVLFVVAAFRTGPWWGVGVLFGGLTCGIVPLIFFFSHLEECKKAFFLGVSGLALFMIMAVAVPNFVRAKAAAASKQQVMNLRSLDRVAPIPA